MYVTKTVSLYLASHRFHCLMGPFNATDHNRPGIWRYQGRILSLVEDREKKYRREERWFWNLRVVTWFQYINNSGTVNSDSDCIFQSFGKFPKFCKTKLVETAV